MLFDIPSLCSLMVLIATLNVCGLRSPQKRRQVFGFCRQHKFDVVCLQECHVSSTSEAVLWEKEWGGQAFWALGSSQSRGVGILLSPSFNFDVVKKSCDDSGRVVCVVLSDGARNFKVCNMYAPNISAERTGFFKNLYKFLSGAEPLILCGDFNCVEDVDIDKRGGNPAHGSGGSTVLKDICADFNVHDSWRHENPSKKVFTWRQPTKGIACRLDRFYSSKCLVVSNYCFLPAYFTDHDCVSLSILPDVKKKPGLWKCNVSILKRDKVLNDFKLAFNNWKTLKPGFPSLRAWWDDVKARTRSLLIRISCELARERRESMFTLNNELVDLTNKMNDGASSADILRRYECTKSSLSELSAEEARGAFVRSRVKQFVEGEKCTSYFVSQASSRSRQRRISSVRDSTGRVVQDDEEILDVFKLFYEDLFSAEPIDKCEANNLCNNLEGSLDPDEVSSLEGPLSLDELWAALCSMENNKSPGSDGLPKEFYVAFWDVIAGDLLSVFEEVFSSGELSQSQSFGVITLLPKKGDPLDPKNRRPISLLNCDYKILAKVLNNRLKMVAASVISPDQTCGIPGRSIQCNLLLMRDIITYVNMNNFDCAIISLDQAKAFDRVNIDFLHLTLAKMGFGPVFRKWVAILYHNITSAVSVNGSLSSSFSLSRGVRQGCPMSPLLYAISLEPFAATVRADAAIHGLRLPGGREVKISQYADDNSAIVTTDESIRRLFAVIDMYNRGSGSLLNLDKCMGLWLGSWRKRLDCPKNFKWTSVSIRLLGGTFGSVNMPLVNWRERQAKFEAVLRRWDSFSLSFAGKVVVVNNLALSTLWYIAPVFSPPESVVKDITRAVFKFFWSYRAELVSRQTVLLPLDKGGWDLIDFGVKANCFYCRPFTNILDRPDLPWVQLAKYWLGFFARRFEPSSWSNSSPHSPEAPPHYSLMRKLTLEFVNASASKTWDRICTVQSLYKAAILARSHTPSACFLERGVDWSLVFSTVHNTLLENNLKELSWKVAHGALKTNYLTCSIWHRTPSPLCPRRNCRATETVTHAIWSCGEVLLTWTWVEGFIRRWVVSSFRVSRAVALYGVMSSTLKKCKRDVCTYILAVARSKIWWSRCQALFDNNFVSHIELVSLIKEALRFKLKMEFVRLGSESFLAEWCQSVKWASVRTGVLVLRF